MSKTERVICPLLFSDLLFPKGLTQHSTRCPTSKSSLSLTASVQSLSSISLRRSCPLALLPSSQNYCLCQALPSLTCVMQQSANCSFCLHFQPTVICSSHGHQTHLPVAQILLRQSPSMPPHCIKMYSGFILIRYGKASRSGDACY